MDKIKSNPSKVKKMLEILQKNEAGISSMTQSQQQFTPRSQKCKEPLSLTHPPPKRPYSRTPLTPMARNVSFNRSQSIYKRQGKDGPSNENDNKQNDLQSLYYQIRPIYKIVIGENLELAESDLRFDSLVGYCETIAESLCKIRDDLVKKPDTSSMLDLVTQSLPLQKAISNQLDSSKKSFADYYAKLNSKLKGDVDKLIADKDESDVKIEYYKQRLERSQREIEQLRELNVTKQKDYEQLKLEMQKEIQLFKDKLARSKVEKEDRETQTDAPIEEDRPNSGRVSSLKEIDGPCDVNFLNPSEIANIYTDENANFPSFNIRDRTSVSLVHSDADTLDTRCQSCTRSRRSSISCVSSTTTKVTKEFSGTNTIINKVYHVTFNVHNCQNVNIGSNVKYNRLGSA